MKLKNWIRKGIVCVLAVGMAVQMTGCMSLISRALLDDDPTSASSSQGNTQAPTQDDTGHNGNGGSFNSIATGNQSSASASGLFSDAMVRDKLTNTDNAKSATVLVYMNGSNLESDDSEATIDLSEMVAATHSDAVNVVVQTMGTKKWNSKYGISSSKTQRFLVGDNGLTLVDDSLKQLDCTQAATLLDFIQWGEKNYPADRYILVFWNHGGGPVYGFGYDEWNSDSSAALTLDEMQLAINNSGVKFDFIGMDCCIMSSLETCMAFYDVCDYSILSEEFETGIGWSYTGWLSELAKDPSINTEKLAKIVIDDMVSANEKDSQAGGSSTLACIDESMVKVLYTTWKEFAYANESTLLSMNFSTIKQGGTRAVRSDNYSLEDYFVTDMMALAQSVNASGSAALESALNNSLVYYRETADETTMTGLSVTLPYSDSNFYKSMSTIFKNCGFEAEYVTWLEKFVGVSGSTSFFDYDDWNDTWDGWDDFDDDFNWDDWDFSDDDSYWDDDNWDWADWDYSDYFDDNWYDEFWNSFDYDYWFGDDNWFYDDDYGYYDPGDGNWYDNADDWYENWSDGDGSYDDWFGDYNWDDWDSWFDF